AVTHSDFYTRSLHDALPISSGSGSSSGREAMTGNFCRRGVYLATAMAMPLLAVPAFAQGSTTGNSRGIDEIVVTAQRQSQSVLRSEEHTSELQSREKLVCRL